jgi:CHAT domain-containing protein/tetratricopeptide (TPR) repeat protein
MTVVNVPIERTGFLLLGLLMALAAPAAAEDSPVPPQQQLNRAEERYRQGQLAAAERAYRRALPALTGAGRRLCYDRLLAIYARVGRSDQAIRLALEYEPWARRQQDFDRVRELNLALGKWYLALGHGKEADKHLQRVLAEQKRPLPPGTKVTALTYLALAAARQGDQTRAGKYWAEVGEVARAQADDSRRDLDPRDRIDWACRLSESYRCRGRPEEAIPRLELVLPLYGRLGDRAGKRDTLQLLATLLVAVKRPKDAERHLRAALRLQEQIGGDRLAEADLSAALADVLDRQGRPAAAEPWRQRAVRAYRAAQAGPSEGPIDRAQSLAAFWKLQQLYQRHSQYERALRLARGLAGQWAGDPLVACRLKAEQGGLEVLLGEYRRSRPLLREVLADLERRSPPDLVELPRVLLNLAVVELVTGGRARAAELGERCRDLYRKQGLPDDLVRVEACNLLGSCAAQDGDYARAVRLLREGVAVCGRLGETADPQRSNLLLNLALVHKAQGDLGQALTVAGEAETVCRRFAGPDSLTLAALAAARASLLAARAQVDEADRLAGEVLRLCDRHGVRGGPLLISAYNCRGLCHLRHRRFADAEKEWRLVEDLQGPDSPQLPRTLNYRALTRECQGKLAEAEELYRQTRRLQEDNPHAFPVTHFATLWRLANLLDRRGRPAEARALLEEAVTVVERARLRTYGDAEQRAAFFAQFAPGLDQSVTWSIRDRDIGAAVVAAARNRSRTLLDQLLMAGVDPRTGLRGDAGDELRRREADLRRQIAMLRGQAQLLLADTSKDSRARDLLARFDRAQQEYAEVYREILNVNPVYRALAQPPFSARELANLRTQVLGPKKLLLVYYVGREGSYLLLLGAGGPAAEAFGLTVPASLAERAASPARVATGEALAGVRGLVLERRVVQPELPPAPPKDERVVPLTPRVLRALVESYLEQVANPHFQPTRGLRLPSRASARPLPAQRPELLGDVLLPPRVRARIRALAPKEIIIIPDGALHKLPFEALLLQAGSKPVYALDELPPLSYAPSVAILDLLARRAPTGDGPLSLLTVADPAYPQAEVGGHWQGGLPRLRFSGRESQQIARLFPAGRVTELRGEQAAKQAVLRALSGKRIVHIAAHGFADDRFGNLFGALALTPPPAGRETAEDDGFLSLHEVCALPLHDCELAVLSACVTNVGPRRPLEAGVTLAGAFLAAGARRVVASHWSVADRSTAALMEVFFEEVTSAHRRGHSLSYAAALRQARLHVRRQPRWSSPFYWAPFVLLGPGR